MSWQAVTWVLEQSEAELGSRLVLLSIASHANREGQHSCPTLDTICKETLISRREAIYCIQTLEELGELRVERGIGRGNPNRYALPRVAEWVEIVQGIGGKYQKKVQRLHQLESVKGATEPVKGAICNTKRCNALSVSQEESTTSPLQPLEPYKERTVIREAAKKLFPEPSKPPTQNELRKRVDKQLAALRTAGYLQ
jgi:Helix-turn-helix domain